MTKDQIKQIRESVASHYGARITTAQLLCAEMVGVKLRTWQSWEYGDRSMGEPEINLLNIKLAVAGIKIGA